MAANFTMRGNGRITIDGRDFVGRSVVINNDVVIIDGVVQEGKLVGPVNVTLHGDAESIETSSGTVTVTGRAGSINTQSGNVRCGDVEGGVQTMSGGVNCGSVKGPVRTMSGSVNHR